MCIHLHIHDIQYTLKNNVRKLRRGKSLIVFYVEIRGKLVKNKFIYVYHFVRLFAAIS